MPPVVPDGSVAGGTVPARGGRSRAEQILRSAPWVAARESAGGASLRKTSGVGQSRGGDSLGAGAGDEAEEDLDGRDPA